MGTAMQADIEGIYRRHRREMLAMAVAITNCPNRAQDAVQTAFCRLCASGRRANGDQVAYAFAAVRNAAIDQKRALAAGAQGLGNREADPCPEPLEELIAGEDRRLVRGLVRALPRRQREVVALHLYAGLTFQQVADALDAPLWTVTSRYRCALNHLREALNCGEWSRPRLRR